MNTQPSTSVASTPLDGSVSWPGLDWATIQASVRKTQLKIAQATRKADWRKVKRLQRLLIHSFHSRCLAVRRVTENRGRRTPGIDGETWETPLAKLRGVKLLSRRRGYCSKPLRRVWIPTPGRQEKRPLGIPTMLDRAMQALHLMAVEPVVESQSDPRSYGFRPDRSTADAMVELFHLLAPQVAPTWILEGDIKGFFDNISHDWLCQNIPMDKTILRKWLKTGVVDQAHFVATDAGTPQGGIISPCLANATLNGLEFLLKDHLKKRFGALVAKKTKVQVVRYADDFVVMANSKELLENEVRPWIEQFLFARGVALSQDKTHIVHIHQGFDFLGWNFRKYVPKSSKRKAKLMIKPSKKNVSAFYRKVRDIIKNSGALTQDALMGRLNPVLRGWAQYHSPVVAKATFSKLDNLIFWRIFRWAKRRHPRKSVGWIKRRYYCSEIHRAFVHPLKGPDGMVRFRQLYMLADTAIVRHKRLPLAYQPYDAEQEFKWEALRVQRMLHKLRYRRQIHSLFRRQQGICALCGHAISKDTGWHDHHVVRRVDGGSDKLENRALLHPDCHLQCHELGLNKPLQYNGLQKTTFRVTGQ